MEPERVYAAIERAVALMSERLEDADVPTLGELAAAACLSKYHFHRVYTLVTGESTGETVQRLRLARAGKALAEGESVTEAAHAAGYGSGQALAKALRNTIGTSATELRHSPGRLARTIRQLGAARVPGPLKPIAVELASLEPFVIVAVRTEGRYPEVANVYEDLARRIGGMENALNIFGVTMNNSACGLGGDLVFHCGFQLREPLETLPGSLHQMRLGEGDFLVARHLGCFSRLEESMDALYWCLLQAPGVEPADRPTFMHYLDDPEHTEPGNLRTDIYLPVDNEDMQ